MICQKSFIDWLMIHNDQMCLHYCPVAMTMNVAMTTVPDLVIDTGLVSRHKFVRSRVTSLHRLGLLVAKMEHIKSSMQAVVTRSMATHECQQCQLNAISASVSMTVSVQFPFLWKAQNKANR